MVNKMDEIEIALLGFLYNESKHGYDLHKEISDLSGIGIVWHVKMGKLYAMLHKLENSQWVDTTVTQEGNRPQRTQYRITPQGKRIFNEWLGSPVKKGRDFRIIFLLKMYFALKRGENKADQLIAVQKEACNSWLEEFKQSKRVPVGEPVDFKQIVTNFRVTQINGYLDWLAWCEKHIHEEDKAK
jgi:DNA-binding PadR family transcriptional regulator